MYNDYTYRVEKELAMMLASVSHHLHPEIVSYIKNKNLEFKSEFESYSHPKLNIEDFLFDGSDCLFPGLRRPVNKEKTTKKWKNNIALVPQDVFLYDSSILENIAFCVPREKIDIPRVKKAAKNRTKT